MQQSQTTLGDVPGLSELQSAMRVYVGFLSRDSHNPSGIDPVNCSLNSKEPVTSSCSTCIYGSQWRE